MREEAKQKPPDLDGPVREDEFPPELNLPILILAPLRNDARFTATFLASAGLSGIVCEDVQALCTRGSAQCGALLLAEEALDNVSVPLLSEYLSSQPRWSDLPVIIITSNGDDTLDRRQRLGSFGRSVNVMLVERPFRPTTLVSTLQGALRSRQRHGRGAGSLGAARAASFL